MAINEWKIWQKLNIVKKKEEFIDIDKDLDAILEFFKDIPLNLKKLILLYSTFKLLRKQELKLNKSTDKIIKNQIRTYDKILKTYEILELDTDINGERVKKIAKALAKKAQKLGMNKTIKKEHWTFDW